MSKSADEIKQVDSDDNNRLLASAFNKDELEYFNAEQKEIIGTALARKLRVKHKIDIRFTIKFFRKQIYIVLLAGKERRPAARLQRERLLRPITTALNLAVISAIAIMFTVNILAGAYVVKRALSIDLIPFADVAPDETFTNWFKSIRSYSRELQGKEPEGEGSVPLVREEQSKD
ncbi:hypothetical protein ACMXYX_00600 [Neptuniibacter sp. QD72_48]|uniref:hypothetical protein n=1 Tax=unclassified Neptuniibacter TaxID=2630693 RepID=UPI0039F6426B